MQPVVCIIDSNGSSTFSSSKSTPLRTFSKLDFPVPRDPRTMTDLLFASTIVLRLLSFCFFIDYSYRKIASFYMPAIFPRHIYINNSTQFQINQLTQGFWGFGGFGLNEFWTDCAKCKNCFTKTFCSRLLKDLKATVCKMKMASHVE